jgi:hypothetical protein
LIFLRGVGPQLQNYATVELKLGSFAQSKRARDPWAVKTGSIQSGLFSAFLCVFARLREQD